MKRTVAQLTVFLAALTIVAQTPKAPAGPSTKAKQTSPLAEYSGNWNSTLDGKVWLRLRLVLQGDKLTGEMFHARDIKIDDSGGLKSVSEEQSSQTVTDAVLNPDGLVLTLKDLDTQESTRFLMRLALPSKQTADLKVIGLEMPPGMAKPKPWNLERAGGGSPTQP